MSSDDGALDEDTGEPEPEPERPAEPTPSDEPLIPGALWSVLWELPGTIFHIDSSPLGLGLANRYECALLDLATGEPKWTLEWASEADSSALRLIDDELIWARRKHGVWTLNHFDESGQYLHDVEVEGPGGLALDDGGAIYVEGADQLTAHAPDGTPIWTTELTAGYDLATLEGLTDGVLLFEHQAELTPVISGRARRYDAAGVELAAVEFSVDFALALTPTVVGDRVYLASQGLVHAVDLDGGLAWTIELGSNLGLRLAPGPDQGVYALLDAEAQPAQLVRVAVDGEVTPVGEVSTAPIFAPLLHTGAGGELLVGGHHDDQLELHRLL
ncbi:MAG TPA: PQQ-binding-like beta-propeller repeat protein [Enhygromyxa sp.]|nr:PQQ-binding-like beta-propeller repeat protein [Enhygromyxa sp.]